MLDTSGILILVYHTRVYDVQHRSVVQSHLFRVYIYRAFKIRAVLHLRLRHIACVRVMFGMQAGMDSASLCANRCTVGAFYSMDDAPSS